MRAGKAFALVLGIRGRCKSVTLLQGKSDLMSVLIRNQYIIPHLPVVNFRTHIQYRLSQAKHSLHRHHTNPSAKP